MTDDAGYDDKPREEVAAVIPASAREILDVGCAGGGFGRALKSMRQGVRVRGLEPNEAAAVRARSFLDAVHVGGFDGATELPRDWPAPDCIVFADVLEHMADPWSAVRRATALLAPGGSLVASIPNVSHVSVIAGLLRGRFDYADYGILDRTHLRFFTRPSAIELVESAGLRIRAVHRTLSWHHTRFDERRLHRAISRTLGTETTRERRFRGPLATIADALTWQFVIVAAQA